MCQFHYLWEAARPIYEADRHAKKELKKKVRVVRTIERHMEGRSAPEGEVIRGYCSAVRSSLTDDGRPPLEASGLKLQDRPSAIGASLDRAAKRGGLPAELQRLKGALTRALEATAELWPPIRVAFGWVHRAAHLLGLEDTRGRSSGGSWAGCSGRWCATGRRPVTWPRGWTTS